MLKILALLTVGSLIGCVDNRDPESATREQATGAMPNGWSLNGPDLNGVNSAATGAGVMLSGVLPLGQAADGSPVAIHETGPALAGSGLVGSTWTGVLSNGQTLPLTITAEAQGDVSSDLWRYTFFATVAGQQVPLCTDPDANPIPAETVRGTWNVAAGVPGGGAYHPETAQFTVACWDSAISKCLELGYQPWAGLADEAAACVRAIRGDYCGNGTPYTVEGILIGIFDIDGIQVDDHWPVEAAWTPGGAACVQHEQTTRFARYAHGAPSCFGDTLRASESCGMGSSPDVAIVTELPAW